MVANAKNGFLITNGSWQNHYLNHPLSILVANLMPNKEETERQFLESFNNLESDVELTFLYPATHHFKHVSFSAIAKAYVCLADIENCSFDGLIITGAPVEQFDFQQVDYWEEFQTLCDWAQRHTNQTLLECWAALGGLYNDFQINKRSLGQKIFGIYSATNTNPNEPCSNLTIPQSRHATVDAPDELPAGLEVVATNDQIGPLIYQSRCKHRTYITGHPEYEAQTLANEYYRDLKKRLPIQEPQNYFSDVQTGEINYSWRSSSQQLYQSWLNTIELQKVGALA